VKAWQILCDISRAEFKKIYDRLDIKLEEVGESFYNPMLPGLVKELIDRGIAKEDKGAICIFVPKSKVPMMVQKSDGGFNYDTTDLAAIRYRIEEKGADWIIYITDSGQEAHFKLLFEGAKLAGYLDPMKTKVDHMHFGLVLQESEEQEEEKGEEGKDGKKAPAKKKVQKIKTREGKSVKLLELLDEAKARALAIFQERLKEDEEGKVQVDQDRLEETAEILGISSIKYYDLKQNRISNYVFSFDKMLDPKGNTGVYLLYMYVRICSILRKANVSIFLSTKIAIIDGRRSLRKVDNGRRLQNH
jgi:arginyl-tRNA synthetase